jgi:hypothetical protein
VSGSTITTLTLAISSAVQLLPQLLRHRLNCNFDPDNPDAARIQTEKAIDVAVEEDAAGKKKATTPRPPHKFAGGKFRFL